MSRICAICDSMRAIEISKGMGHDIAEGKYTWDTWNQGERKEEVCKRGEALFGERDVIGVSESATFARTRFDFLNAFPIVLMRHFHTTKIEDCIIRD